MSTHERATSTPEPEPGPAAAGRRPDRRGWAPAVAVVVLGLGLAGVAAVVARRGSEPVAVATVGQAPGTTAAVPEAPVTFEGVAARLDCPDPPDPNGAAPNPPMPSNLASATYDYAPGAGAPTAEAAVRLYVGSAWPGLDPGSLVATASTPTEVRFENRHAALLVTLAEGGVWTVSHALYCRPNTAQWIGGHP